MLGIAPVALAALLVPAVLLARAARADVAVEAVPEPEGAFQAVVAPAGRSGRMELAVGPFPAGHDMRFFLAVLVSSNRATSSFALELRDRDGGRLARCGFDRGRYPVERYRQRTILTCPVARPEALRTVIVEATAPYSPAAILVRRRSDGRYEAGGLLAGQPRGPTAALERLSVARARALRAPTMLLSLGLGAGLLAAALLLATGRADGEPPRRRG
jgi:hypothetical protein